MRFSPGRMLRWAWFHHKERVRQLLVPPIGEDPRSSTVGDGVALCFMADPKELPQQVADLIELTKQYLRQETVDPMKNIGRSVARALITMLLVGLGVVLLALGLHGFLGEILPQGQWWAAASTALTAVVVLLATVIVAGRLRTGDE